MPPRLTIPPLTPAEVVYINAHLDETRGPRIVAISILLIVVSIVAVMLRFIARNVRKLPWQIDDYFMLPALFFTVLLCVENIICVHYGSGRHIFAVGFPNIINVFEGIYFLSVTYGFVHFFIKMSILLLYRRLFSNINRAFVIGLRVTMVYVTAWSVATALACIFQCTPISFFWLQFLPNPPPNGTCIAIGETEISLNVLNTVGDIMTLLLPILALRNLRMSTGKKVGVAAIFMVGIFAVAAGIARIFMIFHEGADSTWTDADLVIWTAIEPAIGILCACFPVIAPAFSRGIIKNRFGSGSGGSFLRKLFHSKTTPKSPSEDSMPLSFISSAHAGSQEVKSHPFKQLNDSSDKESHFVIQSNVTQPNSVLGRRDDDIVPEYEADGALPALPQAKVRPRSDIEWGAKYPH